MDLRSKDTSSFLLFMDQLFDSLNGYLLFDARKPLKKVVRLDKDSPHTKFWQSAIETLRTFKSSSTRGTYQI